MNEEQIMNIMNTESEEYDIWSLIKSISSDEEQDIVAKLLYFDLNDIALCNFFNKSNEWLLNNSEYCTEEYEDTQECANYRFFQRTFNLIKFKMNEILRKRLGTEKDDFRVFITSSSGETYTYFVDLTDMTISHMNSSGNYILNYEADTNAVEYLLSKDPDIHLCCGLSPNIIHVSRVITPIHTFVLRKF